MEKHGWLNLHLPLFLIDNFLRYLSFYPPKRILSKFLCEGDVVAEIGCGRGYLTISIAEIVGPGGRVYATDSDEKSIEVLRSKARKKGYEKIIESKTRSPADLRFIPDSSVDFVFANGLLCCVSDHAEAIQEIKRILKKCEGQAYLSVSNALKKRKDELAVSKGEWRRVLGDFDVLDQREGILSFWAVVSTLRDQPQDRIGIRNTDQSSMCQVT